MRPIAILALSALLQSAGPTQAETVRVRTERGFGHAWLHVSQDGICRIATPAHVVAKADGTLSDAIVIDRRGFEREALNPVQPDPDVDLAFLDVATTEKDRICTNSRLGLDRLDARLESWREGFLTTSVEGETRTMRVERRAASMDERAGAVFAVVPMRREDRIVQGMSGSAVLDATAEATPLGLLIEAVEEDNLAIALRFDIVKALASHRTRSEAPRRAEGAILETAIGATPDPAEGPRNLLRPGALWRVAPVAGRVRVVLRFPEPISFSRIEVERTAAPGALVPDALEISIAPLSGAGAFRSVGFCRADPGSERLACRTPPVTASSLQLTFSGPREAQQFAIGPLTLD